MKYEIKTESGSTYMVDTVLRRWSRFGITERSGPLRTESGSFLGMSDPEVGKRLDFFCQPLTKNVDFRMVSTSRVTEIKAL